MSALCPHCGFDLELDEPIERGDLRIDPRGPIKWKGETVKLSPSRRTILHALLKANGTAVSRHALAERCGYEGDDAENLVAVHLCRIAKTLPGAPIETIWGVGVRWAA